MADNKKGLIVLNNNLTSHLLEGYLFNFPLARSTQVNVTRQYLGNAEDF
jgi:hypothetical protein